MIVFKPKEDAESMITLASLRCSLLSNPGCEGQSILPTVVTQAARNSLCMGGIVVGLVWKFPRWSLLHPVTNIKNRITKNLWYDRGMIVDDGIL